MVGARGFHFEHLVWIHLCAMDRYFPFLDRNLFAIEASSDSRVPNAKWAMSSMRLRRSSMHPSLLRMWCTVAEHDGKGRTKRDVALFRFGVGSRGRPCLISRAPSLFDFPIGVSWMLMALVTCACESVPPRSMRRSLTMLQRRSQPESPVVVRALRIPTCAAWTATTWMELQSCGMTDFS